MKFLVRIYVITLVLIGSSTTYGELIDSVAAVVDGEVILLSDLMGGGVGEEIKRLRATLRVQSEYEQSADEILQRTLEEGIAAKILYREALRASMVVGDAEIEDRIDQVRNNYDTNEEFMAFLSRAGETLSDNREKVRKQIMAQRMSYFKIRQLEDGVVISENEVTEFYEKNKEQFVRPERVYTRQIMIRSRRNTDDRIETKALLEQVRTEILAGADFGEMARKHSDLDGASEGGVIGWQARGEQRKVLEDAAFALDPGEVSGVVESQFGVHLIKVDEREEEGGMDLSEARANIEPYLRREKTADKYDRWMSDLRQHSNVRILLKGV